MRNSYRSILLLLIALIIAGGVLLFILRDQLLDVLREQTGVNALMSPSEMAMSSAKNVLDTTILSSPAFLSLKDHVTKFEFDNICQRGGSISSPVTVVVGEEAQSSAVQEISCVLGNSAPFASKNKK